jgi:hypothetical protein
MAATAASGRFSAAETFHLLDIMESICPIGPDEWEHVVTAHARNFNTGHDSQSIRRKYNSLANRKVATSDPNIPDEVKQAKRIRSLLNRKALSSSSSPSSS